MRSNLVRGGALAALLAAVVATASCGGGGVPAPRAFELGGHPMADCVLAGSIAAKCGALSVSENPAAPTGRQIDISVRVVPAIDSPPDAPVFFLSGGPGGAAITDWAIAPQIYDGLTQRHDVVLVDQRGTGLSHALVLPDPKPGESLAAYARRALASLDGDPRFYTTSLAMDDLDAVRAALGYDRIDLYGGSYGATAVQYYMRQHPTRVNAVVLDGATLLTVPVMELIARNSQLALDDLFARCDADASCGRAFPRLRQEFAEVLVRLDAHPVTTSFMGADGALIVVTHDLFAGEIHNRLLSATDSATVPRLIHRVWARDYTELLGSGGPAIPNLVMSIVIRCSEAWARFDPDQVRTKGAGSYYLHAQVAGAEMQALGCAQLPRGVVPPGDDVPARSNAPVLFLTGAADPQDPPANIAGAAADMPDSVSIVVPGQGHTVGHIGCLTQVVVRFFDRSAVDVAAARSCAASLVPRPFVVG